jgi:hypothetical protein
MKNREKYAEQIIDMALNDIEIAVDKEGRLCDCNEIDCNDCMFCIPGCRERLKEWSEQEYVKPTVDWSKVPVDTKILVRDSEDGRWEKDISQDTKIILFLHGATDTHLILIPDTMLFRIGSMQNLRRKMYECQKAVYSQRSNRKILFQS